MFHFKRFSTVTSGRVSGPGTLWTVNVNTGASSAVVTVYDSDAASGTPVAVIDASAPISRAYGVYCHNGIFVDVSGGNADVTIGYA